MKVSQNLQSEPSCGLLPEFPLQEKQALGLVAELEATPSRALIGKLPYPVLADIDPTAVCRIWT